MLVNASFPDFRVINCLVLQEMLVGLTGSHCAIHKLFLAVEEPIGALSRLTDHHYTRLKG